MVNMLPQSKHGTCPFGTPLYFCDFQCSSLCCPQELFTMVVIFIGSVQSLTVKSSHICTTIFDYTTILVVQFAIRVIILRLCSKHCEYSLFSCVISFSLTQSYKIYHQCPNIPPQKWYKSIKTTYHQRLNIPPQKWCVMQVRTFFFFPKVFYLICQA